jgi:hypothetical protein
MFAQVMKGPEHGIMLESRTDYVTTRLHQAKDDIIKSVCGVVRKDDSVWIVTIKEIADLTSYSGDKLFSSNS